MFPKHTVYCRCWRLSLLVLTLLLVLLIAISYWEPSLSQGLCRDFFLNIVYVQCDLIFTIIYELVSYSHFKKGSLDRFSNLPNLILKLHRSQVQLKDLNPIPNPIPSSCHYAILCFKINCQEISEQRVKHTVMWGMVQSSIGFSSKLVAQRKVTNSAGWMSLQRGAQMAKSLTYPEKCREGPFKPPL